MPAVGSQDVYGFRVGTDSINLSGNGRSDVQSGGSTTVTSTLTGTTYHLRGVTAGLGGWSQKAPCLWMAGAI